jgi:hypothetical protein
LFANSCEWPHDRVISNESPTPEDEGLHLVQRNEPKPNLLYTALSRVERAPEPERPERFTFFTLGRVSLIVGIVLFIGSLFASSYLIQQLHREAGIPEAADTPSVATSIAPTAAPSAPKAFVPVTPDMLHVTSISLGDVRLTVVNSKQLAEDDWLPVTTPDGIIQVRVAKIEDGVVHFEYDGKTIDAKLTARSSARKSP